MKSPKINGLLVLMNLGLLLAVGYLVNTRPGAPPAVGSPVPPATNEPRIIIKGSAPRIITVTNEFSWAQLESEDYRAYIARLRAIGCPEQTIRDIVIADLDKLLAPRVQSIYGRRPNLHYWHSEEEELANDHNHRAWARQERAIDREKREVILELLGVDLVRERMKLKGFEDYYERRLSFLPEERRTQVRMLLEKYDDLEAQITEKESAEGEALTDDDKARLSQLQAQRQTELTNLLTSAEREQYELWMSSTANAVRYALYGMSATQEEFLAVYKLRKTFDEQWNPEQIDLNNDANLEKWVLAKNELDAQVKEALGEQRFAEYKRGEDADFHQLNATVSRFNLPREKAGEAYEIKKLLIETRTRVQADPALTEPQKEQALKEMAAEAEQAVKEVLGDKAFGHYTRSGMGLWLKAP